MLGDKTAVAVVAVRDMAAAKAFYEEKLGLSKDKDTEDGGVLYKTGSSRLFVYQSQFAGTNQATAVTFGVGGNIKEVAEGLKAKGVTFEHYDNMPNVTMEGDVHVMGDIKAAWFKDPDGNIISLINEM